MEFSQVVVNVKGGPYDGEHVWDTNDDPLSSDNFAGTVYDLTSNGTVGKTIKGISPAAKQRMREGCDPGNLKGQAYKYKVVDRHDADGILYLTVENIQ